MGRKKGGKEENKKWGTWKRYTVQNFNHSIYEISSLNYSKIKVELLPIIHNKNGNLPKIELKYFLS